MFTFVVLSNFKFFLLITSVLIPSVVLYHSVGPPPRTVGLGFPLSLPSNNDLESTLDLFASPTDSLDSTPSLLPLFMYWSRTERRTGEERVTTTGNRFR